MINWIRKIFDKRATYHQGRPLRDPGLVALFGPTPSRAGVRVDESTALTCSAVWAAVRRISESIASLPIEMFDRAPTGEIGDEVTDHPALRVLGDMPCEYCSSMSFIESRQAHALLYGNGYAEIERTRDGEIVALWPLPPNRVRPYVDPDRGLRYEVNVTTDEDRARHPNQVVIDLHPDDMFHLRGFSSDGISGMSVIQQARESIGLALAAERYGASFFGNSALPSGVLTHPGQLGDEMLGNLKRSWAEAHEGVDRAHRVAILEEGMTWTPMSISNDDAQFLQSREWQITDIARWFLIQPHLIGDLSHATFSNIEHQGAEFVRYTLRPWIIRWEQETRRKLMSTPQRSSLVIRLNVDDFERGDKTTRYSAYATGRNSGFLTLNDILRAEGRATIGDEGDRYWLPSGVRYEGDEEVVEGVEPTSTESTVYDTESTESVQSLALNGAQIGSLVSVVEKVSMGQLSPDAAIGILMASFPDIGEAVISAMVQAAAAFEPAPPPTPDGDPPMIDARSLPLLRSYFSDCDRDDKGHCLPKDGGGGEGGEGESTPKPSSKVAKLAKKAWDIAKMSAPVSFVADNAMKEAGYSDKARAVASVVAVIGDWAAPGFPAGSAAVMIAAVIKKPSITPTLAKQAKDAVVSTAKKILDALSTEHSPLAGVRMLRRDEQNLEAMMMAIGDIVDNADDHEYATHVVAYALEETKGDVDAAIQVAREVLTLDPEDRSYFSECDRDEEGHCLPKDGGGGSTSGDEGSSGKGGKGGKLDDLYARQEQVDDVYQGVQAKTSTDVAARFSTADEVDIDDPSTLGPATEGVMKGASETVADLDAMAAALSEVDEKMGSKAVKITGRATAKLGRLSDKYSKLTEKASSAFEKVNELDPGPYPDDLDQSEAFGWPGERSDFEGSDDDYDKAMDAYDKAYEKAIDKWDRQNDRYESAREKLDDALVALQDVGTEMSDIASEAYEELGVFAEEFHEQVYGDLSDQINELENEDDDEQ